MIKRYFNLTNGMEFAQDGIKYNGFVRIQSTACEQKRWDFILQELDYSFLMDIAAGNTVIVYDCGSNKSTSRAIYQGLAWVTYVLNRLWLENPTVPLVRNHVCSDYFDQCYGKITKQTLNKLNYVKRFLCTDEIYLHGTSKPTKHDGDKDYYKNIYKEILKNG